MTFLWPSQLLLGTRQEFQKSVDSSADPVRTCRQQISKFYWRTKKSDLSLPKPEFHYETLPDSDIPKRQKLIIRLLELKTMQEVRDSGLQTTDQDILRRWRRARVLRLLQAASNPTLLSLRMDGLGDEGGPLDKDPMLISLLRDYHRHEIPAKIRFVVSMATELCTRGQKVVIWATFVENLKLLQKLLKDMHPLMVYGAVPAFQEEDDLNFESRERNIQLFKTREDRNILLANPAACAESISLHKVCHHAVYLERTFNCGQFLQSMDRIHRVGMPRGSHPHYYVPLIRCAIEQVVDRRLRDRQSVLYRLLNDNMPVSGYAGDENFFFDSDGDLESILKEITGEISLSSNGENT
jgi:hypothetical protein